MRASDWLGSALSAVCCAFPAKPCHGGPGWPRKMGPTARMTALAPPQSAMTSDANAIHKASAIEPVRCRTAGRF
jgi:hypothetical protein